MPSYNYEKFLPDAVRSVVSQTFEDFELIIIDDHSKDGSQSIIASWLKRESRVRAIFHHENMGIAKTVNDGLDNARGKYVLLTSSDDMLRHDLLEKLQVLFDQNLDCGVIIVDAAVIDERNKETGMKFSDINRKPRFMRTKPSHGISDLLSSPRILRTNVFRELLEWNFVATGAFRRELIREHGVSFSSDLKFLNDWLFWMNLAFLSDFIYVDEPLYYYRLHKGASYHHKEDTRREALKVFDIIIDRYPDQISRRQRAYYTYGKSNFFRNHGSREQADLLLFKAILLYPTPSGLIAFAKALPWLSGLSKYLSGRSKLLRRSALALEDVLT